ncbi:MAG: hypothetical protein J3K34DRAFT_513790 [Monoraphidium minutum]|nr:MAG: hypothetical protein J3K34DRAFT_513790 [Monoraphidium minutum]
MAPYGWAATLMVLLVLSAPAARAATAPPGAAALVGKAPPTIGGAAAASTDLNLTSAANALEGVLMYPELSVITNVIRMEPELKAYLATPGRTMTGFTPIDEATRALLRNISRYAGVAMQNETFVRAIFDYMHVPGRAWSARELYAAAPTTLETLRDGEALRVTRDPTTRGGVLINGFPIRLANQATRDGKMVLHMLDGVLIPPSQMPLVNYWLANGRGGGGGGEGGGAEGEGGGAAAPEGARAASGGAGAARRAAGAAALLAALAAAALAA